MSDECKDLVKKLLAKDPAERIELIEARTHSWFSIPEDELQAKIDKAYKSFNEAKQ